ncbi:MAG: DUF6328 family protein [Dehalococcoidia bacterium]
MPGEDEQAGEVRHRLEELMADLRVAIPGVQVLFGFLLTLPFTSRFGLVATGTRRTTFFVAFVAAAIASILLIAPSALHRIYHELGDPGGLKPLLLLCSRLAVCGLGFLAVALGAVVFLVTDILDTQEVAAAAAAGLSGMLIWLWFALPILHRLRYRATKPTGGVTGR